MTPKEADSGVISLHAIPPIVAGITEVAVYGKLFTEKKQAAAADLVEGVDFVVVESRESL